MKSSVALKDVIEHTDLFKKIKDDFFISSKYHATTSRLRDAFNYLIEAKKRLGHEDIIAFKSLSEMALITYSACFNNSKLLLPQSYIPLDEILQNDSKLQKMHENVKYARDKILAHQDKVDELNYDIHLTFLNDKVEELEFPFLTKHPLNVNDDIDNFEQLIRKVHDYLDKKRQEHDIKLLKEIKEIDSKESIFKFCKDNNININTL